MNLSCVQKAIRLALPLLICCSVEASDFFTIDNSAFASHVSADGATVLLQGNNSGSLWTPSAGTLTGLPDGFEGRGISGDGTVVVGTIAHEFEDEAAIWTEQSGLISLGQGDISAQDVSLDGAVVVGHNRNPQDDTGNPYRWTESSGRVTINFTIPFLDTTGVTTLVSADGAVITGRGLIDDSRGGPLWVAYHWSEQTGMVDLGQLPEKPNMTPSDISADGSVVVGTAQNPLLADTRINEAWRWEAETGMVGLGVMPGHTRSLATVVSTGGDLVLGVSLGLDGGDRDLFAWTEQSGMVSLSDILIAEVGDQVELTARSFVEDMSADERTIVGRSGRQRWAVVLDEPLGDHIATVPEPTSSWLLLGSALGTLAFRDRRTGRRFGLKASKPQQVSRNQSVDHASCAAHPTSGHSAWILAISCVTLLATSALAAPPAGKGKDKDSPPSVLYRVEFFAFPEGATSIKVYDANNSGQAVGRYWIDTDGDGTNDTRRGFLYDPEQSDEAIDLNSLVEPADLPEGYGVGGAIAINEWGDIAAFLEPDNSLGESLRAAMIDMSVSPARVHVVPDESITLYSVASDLNELGDLVAKYQRADGSTGAYAYNFGLYDAALESTSPVDVGVDANSKLPSINNNMQVVGGLVDGSAYRAVVGGAVESFASLESAHAINDAGEFCGQTLVPANRKGTTFRYHPYVAWGGEPEEVEIFESHSTGPDDINQSGDIVTTQVLNHRQLGQLKPEDMLDPSDPNTGFWQDTRQADSMRALTNRDSETNFPTVYGEGSFGGITLGTIFVPVSAP